MHRYTKLSLLFVINLNVSSSYYVIYYVRDLYILLRKGYIGKI